MSTPSPVWRVGPHPDLTSTARLVLRRPTVDDAGFWFRIHSDERTYGHAPWARTTSREASDKQFATVVDHWHAHGFGYWVVVGADGAPLGWAGLRRATPSHSALRSVPALANADGFLNLYYRLAPEHQGNGYGLEAARAAVEWGAEWGPELPIVAVALESNPASTAVAHRSGLTDAGRAVLPSNPIEAGPSVVCVSPRLERVQVGEDGRLPADLRDEVLDVWHAVTSAGGAVGLAPDASREEHVPLLAGHEASMAAGLARMGVLRAPTGELLGLAWWERAANRLFRHVLTLKRFQVSPTARRRNLGRLLMVGMQRWARTFDDVSLWELGYRSGAGTGDFYAASGWQEVGRQPGVIQPSPGDFRDGVAMMRRPDGGQLEFNGRT